MPQEDIYKAMRPFSAAEYEMLKSHLAEKDYVKLVMKYGTPTLTDDDIKRILTDCHSTDDFVVKVAYPVVQQILRDTSAGLSGSGFEKLNKDKRYVFFSNHRDIVMDPILLNLSTYENGIGLAQTATGDNLTPDEMTRTVSKLLKNFVVFRSLSPKEMLKSSMLMSGYIHHVLHDENDNVWIAQREGRSKDGNDRSDAAVIKMMCLSRKGDVAEYLDSLHLVPMAISYQWDPNDVLKLPALLAARRGEKYIKAPGEDFESIMTGVRGYKGAIHIAVGERLDLSHITEKSNANAMFKEVARYMDKEIHRMYFLHDTNYVAYDILNDGEAHKEHYTPQLKSQFIARMEAACGDDNEKRELFLAMYANPVINRYKYEQE